MAKTQVHNKRVAAYRITAAAIEFCQLNIQAFAALDSRLTPALCAINAHCIVPTSH